MLLDVDPRFGRQFLRRRKPARPPTADRRAAKQAHAKRRLAPPTPAFQDVKPSARPKDIALTGMKCRKIMSH
jgi:hypothetical protein